MDVEAVQRALNRSRASVYRYANTDPSQRQTNVPFDPKRLNPEHRIDSQDPLLFHPNEVARFARDVLDIRDVKVEMVTLPPSRTELLLEAILLELREIRQILEAQNYGDF